MLIRITKKSFINGVEFEVGEREILDLYAMQLVNAGVAMSLEAKKVEKKAETKKTTKKVNKKK